MKTKKRKKSKVIVIGAGEAGRMVVDEILSHPESGLETVGFIDDNPALSGASYRGIPVLGDRKAIPLLTGRLDPDGVIIAVPSANGRVIRELVSSCEGLGLEVRIVPPVMEIILGDVELSQIRKVRPEDLLGRERILMDERKASAYLRGKRVMVTGGGGSIGRRIATTCALGEPERIFLLGRGENSLHESMLDLEEWLAPTGFGLNRIVPVVADITNENLLSHIFDKLRPDVVFHAAAHKHIRFMEMFPVEAARNNILGTLNLLNVAELTATERFVMVSTDKAVVPASVMGATKRFCEMLVRDRAYSTGFRYISVRFGNVLGTRGSVVPKFRRQIAGGGPVTVSHPEATRYFMTDREAGYLVVKAGSIGEGGEIFVLDMGEPVNILDLARNLITLSGLEPGRDIEIVFTGLGSGEKLHETLLTESEGLTATIKDEIYTAKQEPVNHELLEDAVLRLKRFVTDNDDNGVVGLLSEIIPEFVPHHEN